MHVYLFAIMSVSTLLALLALSQQFPSTGSHNDRVGSYRYEGRDWRGKESWDCEGNRDLFSGKDSNFAALQEAMFIPGKEGVLQTSDELLDVASAYERWMEQQASTTPSSLLLS